MKSEPATIRPAQVAFKDGTLYSARFADIYHSVDGAITEADHVFLGGNKLAHRWHETTSVTIVETGFGCGLNFLTTCLSLKQSGAACRLDFVSVEKHPFTRDDLAEILQAWPQLESLSRELLHAYPPLIPGFHRLHLDAGRVSLTLLFGEAADMLAELDARADAFFLDGFAPARNPGMWSDALFAQIGRIAAPGATAATYSSAALVRKGLERAGFSVEKKAGFGRKRDMLTAHLPGVRQRPAAKRKAVVIGAGIAGTSCASALARRGILVELLDRESRPGSGSSSNPAAVIRPFLTLDAGVRNSFGWAAFLYAVRLYRDLSQQTEFAWRETGVLQLARDAAHRDKLMRAIELLAYPPDLARLVEGQQASDLCGAPINEDGIWFPAGGFVDGQALCTALVSAMPPSVRFRDSVEAFTITAENEHFHIADVHNQVVASADVVILANGGAAQVHIPDGAPWLRAVRGQVSEFAPVASQLRAPVCRDGYVTPQLRGRHYVGATYDESRTQAMITDEDHLVNLRRAQGILPEILDGKKIEAGSGWAGVRCVSRDRLPVIGAVDTDLFCCIAMGSRGFSWAPLASEILASLISDAPVPVEASVLRCLSPGRFHSDATHPKR